MGLFSLTYLWRWFYLFQDVVHHGKKLKREKQDAATVSVQRTKGIKSLSKESREKLEAYQNLFYLLQVCRFYFGYLQCHQITTLKYIFCRFLVKEYDEMI